MILFLLQSYQRIDPRLVIRDQFNRSGSDDHVWTQTIVLVGAILVFLVLLHAMFYLERRQTTPKLEHNPDKLFRQLSGNLNISATQRQLLKTMVRDLKYKHPAQILLSPAMYDKAMQSWLASSNVDRRLQAQQLAAISGVLFPKSQSHAP